MPDLRPVVFVVGILITILGVAMLLASIPDLLDRRSPTITACGATFSFIGLVLISSFRAPITELSFKQALLLASIVWVALSLISAVPIWLGLPGLRFVDALFEAASGLSTTGATVLVGLDSMPTSLLLWRAILQWLGGIGMIVVAAGLLPFLRVGGMQIFRIEFYERLEKARPRATKIAAGLTTTYLLLTFFCAVAYWIGGMSGFDAMTHSMTTIATGGFSTHDQSFGWFQSPWLSWVAIFFMIAAALPFMKYLEVSMGRTHALFQDLQVRGFLIFIAVFLIPIPFLFPGLQEFGFFQTLTTITFNGVSMLTGTGYSTEGFDQWGGATLPYFLVLMVAGGCAGSTCCSVKIFRFQVMFAVIRAQFKTTSQPGRLQVPTYGNTPLTNDVIQSVGVFMAIFLACVVLVTFLFSLSGLDFLTSLSGAITTLACVGPGLGEIIGPNGNFASIPDLAKWTSIFAMLAGRLEILPLLIVLTPGFWKR